MYGLGIVSKKSRYNTSLVSGSMGEGLPGAMLTEWAAEGRVYLACGATDMRKSIDGLAALVQEQFQLDPFSPCLFVFCNRQRDKLKILQWDHNGFWVQYRRLERGLSIGVAGC